MSSRPQLVNAVSQLWIYCTVVHSTLIAPLTPHIPQLPVPSGSSSAERGHELPNDGWCYQPLTNRSDSWENLSSAEGLWPQCSVPHTEWQRSSTSAAPQMASGRRLGGAGGGVMSQRLEHAPASGWWRVHGRFGRQLLTLNDSFKPCPLPCSS